MIPATNYAPKMYRNATFSRVFRITDETGAAIDLTGYTAEFVVRASPTYGSDLIVKSSSPAIIIDPLDGKITLTVTAAETSAIPAGKYSYSLQILQGAYVGALIVGDIDVVDGVLT